MTWLAKGGGVDNNVFLTINGLKDEFDFHFAVGNEIHHNPFKDIKGVRFIVCKNLVRPIRPVQDILALIFFIRLIRKEKYDIVHTHETKASLITRLAAYLGGCKYIIYGLHGVTFNDPMSTLKRNMYILIERLTIGVSNLVVGVSKDVIRLYHENKIGTKIPYRVVHSGIDVDQYMRDELKSEEQKSALKTSLGIQRNDVVCINIGRFSHSKGQRFTIKSFAELRKKNSNIKLILVGEGELTNECRQQVRDLGIENDVIFYGFSDTVAKLLSISDIHVLTSLREGLPRVAAEASLMKVPTVAFEVEGIREVITHTENGFIVSQGDVPALTGKIQELIDDPQKRKMFAERVSVHVKKDWDSRVMIQQLRELYIQQPNS
ncbi:MAG: glycosyltransferase family 4 protein [Bacteroidetes bacterium]|nr:glycosyltransferase family 4 protein [Bacteroidota bacterium]